MKDWLIISQKNGTINKGIRRYQRGRQKWTETKNKNHQNNVKDDDIIIHRFAKVG